MPESANFFKLLQIAAVFFQIVSRSYCILNGGTVTFNAGESAMPPRFLSRGNTFRVVAGDTVILPCEVQNLGSFVIVWRKGTALLSAGQQMISRDPRLSLLGSNLQLRDIRHPDQGDYTCQIGDGSSGDLIHTVEILMPPSLQILPPNGQTTTRKGAPVSFECRANGNPPPVVQWSKKDSLLPSGLQVQPGYLLSLANVQREHAGVYQCTASNGIGTPVIGEVVLHVLYPPEVSMSKTWLKMGDTLEAKLDCKVHADPPAEVMWYQDSFPIQPTDRRVMTQSGSTHSLVIKGVKMSDFGNYSCSVVNNIGRQKQYIELTGKPGPPIITSSGYSAPNQYNLTWNVQSIFPITEVRLIYRRLLVNASYHHPGNWHDMSIMPHQVLDHSTGERSQYFIIRNLVPDSVYECLLQAKNQHGLGDHSQLHQWFTTQRGRPLVHISNNAAYKTSNKITLFTLCFPSLFLLFH